MALLPDCKELYKNIPEPLLTSPTKGLRGPVCCLSVSEIMTIQILFQMVRHPNFKTFYTGFLMLYWKQYFPKLPSYQRVVELMSRAIFPLTLFSQCKCGRKTGIYYIDGSCLPVGHLKRSKRNKVFKEIAAYGRTSCVYY